MACRCGKEIEPRRAAAGYLTCKSCGDLDASEEIASKRLRVGPVFNKGGYQYLGSIEQTKHILKTAGNRKHIPLIDTDEPKTTSSRRAAAQQPRSANKQRKVFSHWEFPVDPKTGIRYKRAVLKIVPDEEGK